MAQFTDRPSQVAIVGMIAVGMAVAISSFSMVRAERIRPENRVQYNCSSGTACVEGHSTSSKTAGVEGVSKGASGVLGGVGGVGVRAYADGLPGPALSAEADSKVTYIFEAYNRAYGALCEIDPSANLTCSGKISGGSPSVTRQRNSSGKHVLTYASQSATATIEDVGTARMYGGVANVQIEPAFASVMERKWYYVFLTPLGDTRGLYVSMKTPTAFQVRETEHGRSSLEFDYRIVARPLDADNDRLPPAPETRMPPSIVDPAQ